MKTILVALFFCGFRIWATGPEAFIFYLDHGPIKTSTEQYLQMREGNHSVIPYGNFEMSLPRKVMALVKLARMYSRSDDVGEHRELLDLVALKVSLIQDREVVWKPLTSVLWRSYPVVVSVREWLGQNGVDITKELSDVESFPMSEFSAHEDEAFRARGFRKTAKNMGMIIDEEWVVAHGFETPYEEAVAVEEPNHEKKITLRRAWEALLKACSRFRRKS